MRRLASDWVARQAIKDPGPLWNPRPGLQQPLTHDEEATLCNTCQCCKGQRLPRWLLDRSPPGFLRNSTLSPAALIGKRVRIVGMPRPKWLWFSKLEGELGTVSDVLHGNSLSDLRVPVTLDNGKSVDLWVEHVQPLREYPAPPSPIVTPPWTRNATRILTLASERYYHWLGHLHCNLRHLEYPSDAVHVCALDESTQRVAKQQGMHSILATTSSTMGTSSKFNGASTFGSASFKIVALLKHECLWSTLRSLPEGSPLLFLDADITLLRDPLPLIPGGYDLVFTDDSDAGNDIFARRNIGFFLAVNNERTRTLASAYLRTLQAATARGSKKNDQELLNVRIRDTAKHLGLRTYTLDPTAFVNGHDYYERRETRPLNVSKLAAVHHNWVPGDQRKWQRAVAYGGILQPGERFHHFKQRLKVAARSLPAWHEDIEYAGPEQKALDTPGLEAKCANTQMNAEYYRVHYKVACEHRLAAEVSRRHFASGRCVSGMKILS